MAAGVMILLGAGFYFAFRPSSGDGTGCAYRYVDADAAEFARRLMARARVVAGAGGRTVYDNDEWWRRARFLPKAGIVECPAFRATLTYAVDMGDSERVEVVGDMDTYRQWRESIAKQGRRTDPFWVDLRRWERR